MGQTKLIIMIIASVLTLSGCSTIYEEIAVTVDEDGEPDPFGGQSGDIPERPGLIEKKTGKPLGKSFGF